MQIRIRGESIGRRVENFVFKNLIQLGLKINPTTQDEFVHVFLPNSQSQSWEIIGI